MSNPSNTQAALDTRLAELTTLFQHLNITQQTTSQALTQVAQDVAALGDQMAAFASTTPVSPAGPGAVAPPTREPDLRLTEQYEGNPALCGGFLLQCRLAFSRSPSLFPNHSAKITFLVNALKGRALRWSQAYLTSHSLDTLTSEQFIRDFSLVFDQPLHQEEAAQRLIALRQGNRSAADHSIDFRIAAEEAGWGETALKGIYISSLSDNIRDQLATRDDPTSLDELITLSVKIDNRIRERRRKTNYTTHNPTFFVPASSESVLPPRSSQSFTEPEPMQIGRTRLTPEERQRRFRDKVCLYCGGKGHFVANCPVRGNGPTQQ